MVPGFNPSQCRWHVKYSFERKHRLKMVIKHMDTWIQGLSVPGQYHNIDMYCMPLSVTTSTCFDELFKKPSMQLWLLNLGVYYSTPLGFTLSTSLYKSAQCDDLGHLLTYYTKPRTAVVQHLVVTSLLCTISILLHQGVLPLIPESW